MLVRWQERWSRWRRRFSRAEWAARHLGFAVSKDPAHAPGLLLVQIDGLGRRQLERAMRQGRMPFLRRLVRRRGYRLLTFHPGQPASTPAVQGELHYGVRTAVPAFSFLDGESGAIEDMMHPTAAKRVEARLAGAGEGLLRGGSSWSNIYSGGAAPEETHFCAAGIGLGDMWRGVRLWVALGVVLLHLDAAVRLIGLLILELLIGMWDACLGIFRNPRGFFPELRFLLARVFVCVGLREIVAAGAAIDVARGLPIVHVNFLGYDEQSHRRGPDSAFAHWALLGIDRCIRRLYHAARRSSRREYDVWIFSDHGQVGTVSAFSRYPGGLEGLVRKHWPVQQTAAAGTAARSQRRGSPGTWFGGPRASRREARHQAETLLSAFEREEFAVASMGPVAHLYPARDIGDAAMRRLAAGLVRDGVPGVLWVEEDGAVGWLEAGGEHRLPRDAELLDVEPGRQQELARDLADLCKHPHAGRLVVIGWGPGCRPWTFANERGAHAGPTRDEVTAFALLPPATWLPAGVRDHLRPTTLRQAALRRLGREPARIRTLEPARQVDPAGRNPGRAVELCVMTYNTHGCLGWDGRISPRRVARLVAHYDADVVALQELDVGRGRSRGENQVSTIADELGLHATFSPITSSDGGSYGHALLTRWPLVDAAWQLLPDDGLRRREPRTLLRGAFVWQGRTVRLMSTHLGLGREERRRQVETLLSDEGLAALPAGDPLILCGDLNLHPGSPGYRRLVSRLRDAQGHAPGHVGRMTFPSILPVRCLDYVFLSAHFRVIAVDVPRDALTTLASDHLPVIARLRLLDTPENHAERLPTPPVHARRDDT